MISVKLCWQASSVILWHPGSLPAAELGFSTAPKYKIREADMPCESYWKGSPHIYRVQAAGAFKEHTASTQVFLTLYKFQKIVQIIIL